MSYDTSDIIEAIEGNDPDRLLRIIDGLCATRAWDLLVDLGARCRRAVDVGRQLWGVAYHADYRLALEAPARYAAGATLHGGGGITLGPLTEVVASTHTWEQLDPFLPPGSVRTLVAHERVIRGEALLGISDTDAQALEVPLALADWEPAYRTATYESDKATFPSPDLPAMDHVDLPEPGIRLDHPEETEALLHLTETWTRESNGRSEAVASSGSALGAIRALGPRTVRAVEVDLEVALAWMAWAGGSGGAYGRRPGAAAGRFAAWWALAALGDLDWPPEPARLGGTGRELRWWLWDDLAPTTGWVLRLAAEDPEHDVAWAISAIDAR